MIPCTHCGIQYFNDERECPVCGRPPDGNGNEREWSP